MTPFARIMMAAQVTVPELEIVRSTRYTANAQASAGQPAFSFNMAALFPEAQDGDIVVAAGAADSANLGSFTYASGGVPWRVLLPDSDVNPGHAIVWGVWDSSRSDQTLRSSGTADERVPWVVFLLRGVLPPDDPSHPNWGGVRHSGTSGRPNPGTAQNRVAGDLLMAFGFMDDDADTFTAPSGWSLLETHNGGGRATVGVIHKVEDGNNTNPGTFGGSGSDYWASISTCIKSLAV